MRLGVSRLRFANEKIEMPRVTKKMLTRIVSYFLPYWTKMLLVTVIIITNAILGLVPPILIKHIIDSALPEKDLTQLGMLIIFSIGVTVILGLLQVAQAYLNVWIAKHIILNMKNQMYAHLQKMSINFYTAAKPGEIITRITSDIDGIQDIFNTTVVSALTSMVVLISTAVVLIGMNWKLAVVGMIILPTFIIPTRKVGKVRWKIAKESQEKISDLNQMVQESFSISGALLSKIFTKEKAELESFKKINHEVINLQIKESVVGRWFRMTITTFIAVGPMLIYFYGGYLFIKGELSIGSIVAFVALLGRLYAPVSQLSNIHIDITRSLALFQRIFDYLDKRAEIENKPGAIELEEVQGKVEFNKVHFSYTKSVKVLDDISFSVEPGMMIALVGSSGVGKTTITNLIPRLYEVNQGKITIDDLDIRDVTLESLRNNIGVVMQEPYLFNATIEENLRYGKNDATEQEMIAACKAAYIHDFIMNLPDKYQTVVGNRGIKLSGGEKQRVSIARVILKDPRIIILDEATSSLDSVSEKFIQKALVPLLKDRTSFVIAHRLSTVLAADQIFVIENGTIAESGRHEELIRKNGLYRKIYDTQFNDNSEICKGG
ncbi:ABC-type multidrug transport system, ATPase and permease component [Desulfosporosinus orientis DSM 765]|uniref:ABC-type multidrug transport system, ATPase and permease component n=1 Tax=Desulfosporosinus orientis (strain ATCC 19365 / DSM 765 / NCIMB 8382 / VKM B-1628 / Singapore I) TaxID=768706 RepID=G7W7Y4_DESOD|nr:ABC transporter ATP-binding protein [Desulfosporosinus orientis]AET66410.1 ABC-type multidrug transport system, ATPase and permease component [Desulfosporosinus orientis DSM 765]